jgi:hypothetical protein
VIIGSTIEEGIVVFVVVCSSSIYRFWIPLWYLQTLLK